MALTGEAPESCCSPRRSEMLSSRMQNFANCSPTAGKSSRSFIAISKILLWSSQNELFSGIDQVRFEGPETTNEFAYRVYDKDRMVFGKRMEEWLRLTVCYALLQLARSRHVRQRHVDAPWLGEPVTQAMAEEKLEAAFDFFTRLGTPYFAFMTWTRWRRQRHCGSTKKACARLKLAWRKRWLRAASNCYGAR